MPDNETLTLQFDLEATATNFKADTATRTITGLAVPWGAVARSGGKQWRFHSGSLDWGSRPSRVKLNLNHDHDKPIGVAVNLGNRSDGLLASFKIASGPEGDRILSLAQDGILDGFSVEVDFNGRDSYEQDPSDKSINDVKSALLRGVALTHEPAFDGARVESIAAKQERETSMAVKPADIDTDDELDTNAQFRATMETAFERLAEVQAKSLEKLGETFSASIIAAVEDLGPEQVRHIPNPTPRIRFTNDPPVYQFGKLGIAGPSLVRDAYHAAFNRDEEAQDRLRRYQAQNNVIRQSLQVASAQFTQITTGNASQVIPPGYRPDLYVPELFQGRPFTDACSRGTIDNASPFTVPIFSTATGAAGAHTEGTNPTDGAMTFGTKTVSPGAFSGILNLSREIVDSANPAIDAIAFAAMREEYARDTEAVAYAMFNNATLGLGGTITAGFVPSGAQASTSTGAAAAGASGAALLAAIRAALALYPFRRFASPNRAVMSQEATSALSAGLDSTGRPLLPSVGATNTIGLGNAVTGNWMIDGLPFVPAWSISGNAAGDFDVAIFASSDVWVWESPLLTFRYEEKLGPATIQLALFGYYGVHVLRPVGLSGIRHTVT